MLTIPEELLLLTIKDDDGEGGFIDIPREALDAAFIGAALMELALENRIDSDADHVWIVDKTPTGEPCVDLVLAKIQEPDFQSNTPGLIAHLIDYADDVRELALEHLVERRILEQVEGRILWILKSRRYPVINGKEIREVKLRLLEILLGDELPEPRDVCLMSLAENCGIISQIVPESELERAAQKLSRLAQMDLIGQNVARYIQIFRESAAYAAYWQM